MTFSKWHWMWVPLTLAWCGNAETNQHFKLSKVVPTAVFIPSGFDDNDNSQIVIDGSYPDACHTEGRLEIAIDPNTKEIRISNGVIVEEASCRMMRVFYTRPVNFGPLPVGDYKLIFVDAYGYEFEKGILPIKKASSKTGDEYLYAPVSEATLQESDDGLALLLRGTLTNSCVQMRGVRVSYSSKDVVEVLPITEFNGDDCRDEERPFEMRVKLKKSLRGKKLIHVRTLNGQAINKVHPF